jgi:hypothetical protein
MPSATAFSRPILRVPFIGVTLSICLTLRLSAAVGSDLQPQQASLGSEASFPQAGIVLILLFSVAAITMVRRRIRQ